MPLLNNWLLLFACWSFSEQAQTRTLNLQVERSSISFSIEHMGFLTVDGSFSEFEATMHLENNIPSSVTGTIKANSIATGDSNRDQSLIGESYLDTKNFPVITFNSHGMESSGEHFRIEGALKIKDIEKAISIPCYISMNQGLILKMQGEVIILRKDFNLDFGAMDALVGEEILVNISLEFE